MATETMADLRRSAHVHGEAIDRCLYNSLMKFVAGVGVGMIFSAAVFRRKMWPVILGGGLGTGMGISDCRYEFKDRSSLPRKTEAPNT